jgi:hypothetical protein
MPPRNKIELMQERDQQIIRRALFHAGFRNYPKIADELMKVNAIEVDAGLLTRYAKKNFKGKTSVVIGSCDGKVMRLFSFSNATNIAAAIKQLDEGKP